MACLGVGEFAKNPYQLSDPGPPQKGSHSSPAATATKAPLIAPSISPESGGRARAGGNAVGREVGASRGAVAALFQAREANGKLSDPAGGLPLAPFISPCAPPLRRPSRSARRRARRKRQKARCSGGDAGATAPAPPPVAVNGNSGGGSSPLWGDVDFPPLAPACPLGGHPGTPSAACGDAGRSPQAPSPPEDGFCLSGLFAGEPAEPDALVPSVAVAVARAASYAAWRASLAAEDHSWRCRVARSRAGYCSVCGYQGPCPCAAPRERDTPYWLLELGFDSGEQFARAPGESPAR